MAIKMVREPSETPNINNIDDIIPMRYAYGGQNGFVIGKGTEISNTVSGLNFTVNSGRLVLQGVECDIDATGVTITIDNIATKRYYTIYLEVNLGLNTATIKSEYDTATYPTIDAGDDLTENSTGIARLPLYQFTATSGIISEVNKVVESVKYINSSITVDNSKQVNNLEIKQDENGVLKIGDIIIPQKKLLWSGNETANTVTPTITIQLEEDLNKGDIIEIEYEYGTFARARLTAVNQDTTEYVRLVKTVCNQKGLTLYGCDATVNKVDKTISFTTANGASISTSGTVEAITGWSMTVTKISKIIE